MSAIIRTDTGSSLYYAGRYAEAIAELRASLDIAPDLPNTYHWLAMAYEQAGNFAEAATAVQRGLELAPPGGRIRPYLLAVSARLAIVNGQRPAALDLVREIAATARPDIQSFALAHVYAAMGDRDRVMTLLVRAEAERSPLMLWVKSDPMFRFLQTDTRFIDLLRRMRLSP
jgi:Flp pilus assembly protein TadD